MCNKSVETIVYRMVLEPISPLSDDALSRCVRELVRLDGFSLWAKPGKENDATEFRCTKEGKMRCRVQVRADGVAIETSRDGDGTERADWEKWSSDLLSLLSAPEAMGWKGRDLAVLAVVHQHRFPALGTNNYEFLRDRILAGSTLYKLVRGMKLADMDLEIQGILKSNIHLIMKVTSNQSQSQILDDALHDERNRLLFEFHAVRLDTKSDDSLQMLAKDQESELEKRLHSEGTLETIREAINA